MAIEKNLIQSLEYAESIIDTVREPLIVLDQNLRVVSASRSFYEIFKAKPAETVGQRIYDLGNKQWDIPRLRELLEDILPEKTIFDEFEVEHYFPTIGRRIMLLNARQVEGSIGEEGIILLAIEDITERRRLENLLADSEERFRRLFETATDGIVLLEKSEGRIVKANQAFEEMLGFAQAEYVQKNLQDIGLSLGMNDFPAMMHDLDRIGVLNFTNVPVTTRSGEEIVTDIYMVDRAELVQCNIRDITKRKQSLEALCLSQQILEEIINAIPVRVFWKDTNLVFLGCNAAFARDAGLPDPKDIAGKDDFQMMWRAQAQAYRCDDLQVIKSGTPKLLIEETQTTPEGATITLLTSKIPLWNAQGTIIGVVGTYMDITERKRTEEALLAAEKKFKNLLETINLIAILLDCDGSIIFCNDFLLQLTGWTRDEVIHKNWFATFLPADIRETVSSIFATTIEKGEFPVHYENPIITRDGQRKDIEWNNSMLRDADGTVTGVASIGTDVTEHKKLEAQLRHAQKMEAVGTLAGGVAHDFNNILQVIMGSGDLVMDTLKAGTPAKHDMQDVLDAACRAADLTKRLLVFSRKEIVEEKLVNINELILNLQKMLLRLIEESIDFRLDLADKPLIVPADVGLLEQMLINLSVNAKDAMPEGGRLTIGTGFEEIDKAYVEAYGYGEPGRYALITVADTGPGMDADTQKKIFEPFFTTKGIGEGTGLGLAITYGIIKQHGGYIKVYSEPGEGTVFKIYLPLSEETSVPDIKPESAVPVKGGSETILVAEDDVSLRKLTKVVLEKFGYLVIVAEDGEDAITKFMENKKSISLVLLDMIMPKKNGKEAADAIRKVKPDIDILFMSGYTMDIVKTKELASTGFAFIRKPFLSRDLLTKVREILDK